jgi:methyl-accepting chemotaxis protein
MTPHPPFFRLAARVVHNVRHRLGRQLNLIERELYHRLPLEARQVVGVTWHGRGADAFAQELNGELLPLIRQAISAIAQLDQQVAAAAATIAQADQQVEATAGQLANTFDQIYDPHG